VTGKEEVGATPEDVADEIQELLDELQDVPPEKALTAAAYFHAKISTLLREEDRKEYYDALEAWDQQQELEPLCGFLRGQTEKTWAKQIKRAESSEKGYQVAILLECVITSDP
jgi:hypothetical protein